MVHARGCTGPLTEVLKQGQFQPMPIETQVVVLYAATKGYLDALSVSNIAAFEQALLRDMDPALLAQIRDTRVISDDTNQALKHFFDGFTEKFVATL